VVTILLGLLIGILIVVVVGVILYAMAKESKDDSINFLVFGIVGALIAYVILILFFTAVILSL
jgi:uncharacterized membrane protein YeaQ/YmgE (transglycosylase-associated protein family)